jgi:hypothetical protein
MPRSPKWFLPSGFQTKVLYAYLILLDLMLFMVPTLISSLLSLYALQPLYFDSIQFHTEDLILLLFYYFFGDLVL